MSRSETPGVGEVNVQSQTAEVGRFATDVDVRPIDRMGDDASVIKAMMVSTEGAASMERTEHAGRINFLMANRHGTPFEHNSMTFFVAAPIFVFREFHRHRIGFSYNEMSGRYTQLPARFYIPSRSRPMKQEGKPGHYIYVPEADDAAFVATLADLTDAYEHAYDAYERILARGHAKEIARACLPVAIFSEMYVTCNARSLMAFLSLRTKFEGAKFPSYPQHEIELVAKKMEAGFAEWFPLTHAAFCEHGRVSP